jgi:hypothetical protein
VPQHLQKFTYTQPYFVRYIRVRCNVGLLYFRIGLYTGGMQCGMSQYDKYRHITT